MLSDSLPLEELMDQNRYDNLEALWLGCDFIDGNSRHSGWFVQLVGDLFSLSVAVAVLGE